MSNSEIFELPVHYNYSLRDREWFIERFKLQEHRSWPFFVIPMPINKDGAGPCPMDEVHTIKYEVWDHLCQTYGIHEFIGDAVNQAIKLSYELMSKELK